MLQTLHWAKNVGLYLKKKEMCATSMKFLSLVMTPVFSISPDPEKNWAAFFGNFEKTLCKI